MFHKTIIILFTLFLVIRNISLKFVNIPKHDPHKLFDLGHHLVPNLKDIKNLNMYYEIIVFIPIITLLILIYRNKNINLLNEYIFYLLLLHTIKCIFYSITILPDASQCCSYHDKITTKNILLNSFTGRCRDLMFSGHMAILFVTWYFLKKDFGIPNHYGYFFNFVVAILMLGLRKHYSVDILTSYFITYYILDNKFYDKLN